MKKFFIFCAAVCLSLSAMAATGLNVYTSGLKSMQMADSMAIEYTLNTDATSLYVVFYDADGSMYDAVILSDAALLTEGEHATKIALPEDMEAGTYTWGITAHGNATTFADVCDNTNEHYSFYLMQDVVVDNSPESPFFGQVYVNMPWAGESDGGTNTTKTQPAGLYVYNPQLELANYQQPYTGGLSLPASNRQSIKRLSIGEDGMVYIAGNLETFNPGVWKMNPATPNAAWTAVLDPSTAASDYVKVAGLEVVEDKLYTLCNISTESGSLNVYDLAGSPYASPVSSTMTMEWMLGNADLSIRSDHRGGFWVVQHRYSLDSYSALFHLSVDKKGRFQKDYSIDSSAPDDVKALLNNALNSHNISYRGTLGVSPDGKLLAMGNDKTVKVFQVSFDESGVPSLTEYCRTSTLGGNIDGIAFDYANNLYCASASSERLYVFPIAKGEGENHCSVPAPSQYTITIESPEPVEVENLWIIGECATANWNPAASLQMTKTATNIFEVEETITGSWFAFTASNSTNWDEVNAARYGANPSGAKITAGTPIEITGVGGDYSFTIDKGTYKFVVDLNEMTVSAEPIVNDALNNVEQEAQVMKLVRDCHIFIKDGDAVYTITGVRVQ